jgi:hypothetical protein
LQYLRWSPSSGLGADILEAPASDGLFRETGFLVNRNPISALPPEKNDVNLGNNLAVVRLFIDFADCFS